MKLTKIAKVESGQDICIHAGFLFDFVAHGKCLGEVSVYTMEDIHSAGGAEPDPVCRFILDGTDKIIPHANAVFFGNEYYEDGDEFPILYANVYNTYAKFEDRHEGVLLAYRVWRSGNDFSSKLVQAIRIGFVEELDMWMSLENRGDVRPYGNFILDNETNTLYAFVMRDKPFNTRYFAFKMPSFKDGGLCEKYGVNTVTLGKEDIIKYFDTDYHRAIQGAAFHGGRVYSLEGGALGAKSPAGIRIVDPEAERLSYYNCFLDNGVFDEPEGIDFYEGKCYYVCGYGDTYILEF